MLKEKLPAIGRVISLLLLIGTITVIVTAFIRARRHPRLPVASHTSALKANVSSVVEGYRNVKTENGRETLRLLAAKDTTYEDGRHELEKVDLTAFDRKQGKSMRIVSDRGSYLRSPGIVTFEGNVKVTSSDGLEVTTESLKYEQEQEVASTEVAVHFRQGQISGSSIGAQLYTREHNLSLLKDAYVMSTKTDAGKAEAPKAAGVAAAGVEDLSNNASGNRSGAPIEIRSDRANYIERQGLIRFEGNARAVQAEKSARADAISGIIDPQTKKLNRIEMRGNSFLKSEEKGKASEMRARDMDFHYDEAQHLKLAVASGKAHARSLEPDTPREIWAEKIDAIYRPGERGSELQAIVTEGRTTMKIEVMDGAPNAAEVSQRVLEANATNTLLREDGNTLAHAEAHGDAVLTVTPKKIKPGAERKRLRGEKFIVDFYEAGNEIKTFLADGEALAEIEPLEKGSKRNKKTLSGKRLTANFQPRIQDVSELFAEGDAKLVDGERHATSARATYNASTQLVAMRGKPLLWDSSSRANADEIDANVSTNESFLRGHVRTTYYSRETAGGAAPFKDRKAPISVASDRAVVKHQEGSARYHGNVRAWQDNDFVRAENMELDKGERVMVAWVNAQSAFYDFEREVEKGRKEVVPVFAQADRITYRDETRTAHYEGAVKIRQGTDRIDAAVADAVMDEEHRLVELTASKDVVLVQPSRRATGDQVVYTAASDTAVLTGNLAMVEDHEREAVTKSPKLTMHLRDARIQANDESGSKKRIKTTHRIQD